MTHTGYPQPNPKPITPELAAYVTARDQTCQLNHPGCTTTIDLVDRALPTDDLILMRRDVNAPDNMQGECATCHQHKLQEWEEAQGS